MERVRPEAAGLGGPCFADSLVGREATQDLETAAKVVGADEVGQVSAELLMAVVVVALDRRVLDRAVHSLDLTVGPRVTRFGQAMIDIVAGAGKLEAVGSEGLAGCNRLLMMEAAEATLRVL